MFLDDPKRYMHLKVSFPMKSPVSVPSKLPSRDNSSLLRLTKPMFLFFSSSERFSYESNLEEPMDWKELMIVGVGAFGTVYSGINLNTGEIIAIKKIQVSPSLSEQRLTTLENEIALLARFDHKNIGIYFKIILTLVKYLGCNIDFEKYICNIFLEYVPVSLRGILNKVETFSEQIIQIYTKQILFGLEYLHSHSIVHRDIKCANILLDSFGTIKVYLFFISQTNSFPTLVLLSESIHKVHI